MDGTALSIEFEQHCLGGQVAWDRVYNLLAVELRPAQPEDAAATAAGAEGITVAILEPSCPEVRRRGCAGGSRQQPCPAPPVSPLYCPPASCAWKEGRVQTAVVALHD